MGNVDLPVAPEQAAPRSTASRSGGGAPPAASLAAQTCDRLRAALEHIDGSPVSTVTPYLEDLEHAADALEAVSDRLPIPPDQPAPRPAPRRDDVAVAEATGVLVDGARRV